MGRRRREEKLNFEEEFLPQELLHSILVIVALLVQLAAVDLCAELDYVSQSDNLLSIPDKERLCDEGGAFVEEHGLHQPVEAGLGLITTGEVFTLMVVGGREIRVVFVFMVELEL